MIQFQDLIAGETFIFEETLYRKVGLLRADQLYSNLPTDFALCEQVTPSERTKDEWLKKFLHSRRKEKDSWMNQ